MSDLAGSVSRRRTLPPVPSSVAEARRTVSELLTEVEREDLAETAVLLVSELATNALLHAGTGVELSVTYDGTSLHAEVADGSPHLPVPRRYASTAGTGRGLMMLEQLVDDWGVRRRDDGKAVWFKLSTGDRVPAARDAVPDTQTFLDVEPADTVSVELLDFPLLLHMAWQEHAEALLRELLLASLDLDDPAEDPIQVHADATDAMAVLEEQVPLLTVAVEPDELMRDATEPFVTLERLALRVPERSVPSFAALDRALEAALVLTRGGATLTPSTQPELQSFRRWVCAEVVGRAGGAEPRPWSGADDALDKPDLRLPSAHDAEDAGVEDPKAAPGRIVADESGRMVTVSAAAAEILGYDAPSDLVGHRIMRIIPPRYRQAHVAGLSMFLLTGRRPLLGRSVEVPALRRDGTEVAVTLRVEAETRAGSTRFVATLEPAGG